MCRKPLSVATDDERIADAVRSFGGRHAMTSPDCPSGSDRVQEAVRNLECDVVMNIQGDEPTLPPAALEALAALMKDHPGLSMGTLVVPVQSEAEYEDPNVVKAAVAAGGRCLYFSRSPIPALAGASFHEARGSLWRHVGVYAFRKPFLEELTKMQPTPLERLERLEQLRALELGAEICAAPCPPSGPSVDVPSDVPAVEKWLLERRP
ncbi:MAG: 3-deoxy-manno-octulosonate cytidylyltransferase [Acidobacteriota bacterium]